MRKQLDGYWYGEAYGTAADPGWCVSPIPGIQADTAFVHTERGDIRVAPAVGLLYTRGQRGRFAGQDHGGLGNVEVKDGAAPAVVGPGYGLNTVLYLRDGSLVQGAPQYGANGLRYQADDGRIVTGDATYVAPDGLLGEYTEVGGIRIGQRGYNCCVQLDPAVRELRLLEAGSSTSIRMTHDPASDSFAIAIVNLPAQHWVGYWLTHAELAALPVFVDPPPPVENRPPIVHAVPNQTHTVGDAVNLSIVASDPDGDPLTYLADGLPPALAIDGQTGRIHGTVTQPASRVVTVTADDGRGGQTSTTFTWTVHAKPPDPPDPPTPQPVEPLMIFIDLRQSDLSAEKCEVIDNGNGTESYRKTNGKIFCLTEEGKIEERDSPGGPFESFVRTPTALVADRPWNGVQRAYLLPYAEVK